ncbi:MAG: hypothetical protein DRO12_03670 [Thermoprotei archaeon]|nr:MAG: hypothetical protein DRO12_03670 [Thermoprotei archaeon]
MYRYSSCFRGVDFKLSLYPSFIYPLFEEPQPNTFIKVYGYAKGLTVKQLDNAVEFSHSAPLDLEDLRSLSGSWLDPLGSLEELDPKPRRIVEQFLKMYPGLRIVTVPKDYVLLFIAIFLSRNTDFHVNTSRWMKKLFRVFGEPEKIVEEPEKIRCIGSSYQLRQLPQALKIFFYKVEVKSCENPDELRKVLLKIPNVGPKVADAYLLFVCRLSSVSPIDTNFMRMLKMLGLIEGKYVVPNKSMCLQAQSCVETIRCRYSDACAVPRVRRLFGSLTGWVQTAAYLHVKTVCRKSLCKDCALRIVCKGSSL